MGSQSPSSLFEEREELSEAEASADDAVDDRIVEALMAGKRARAILFHFRHYGGSPADSWRAIQGLHDDRRWDKPGQDPQFARVERYLAGRDSPKTMRIWVGGLLAVVLVGLFFVVRGWGAVATGLHSYGWDETTAVVRDVRYHEVTRLRHSGGEATDRYIDYRYAYEVDGEEYVETIMRWEVYLSSDDDWMKIGDVLDIVVDPEDPSRSIHERRMYQRLVPVLIGLVVMTPPILILALFAFFEITHRDLERHDPRPAPAV